MKNTYLIFILILCGVFSSKAQLITDSLNFENINRDYRVYVPSIYNANEAVPLIISLHGLGDNIANFSGAGFNTIADTANFIVVTPQALDFSFSGFPIGSSWNSGVGAEISILSATIYPNEDIDDVGFISALIDKISTEYNIDEDRIYATGFSMGGFMCNRLAVELNDKVAAIASVSGTLGDNVDRTFSTPIPVMHVHGTADATIDYNADYSASGGLYVIVGDSVNGIMNFWTSINQTDATPTHDPNYATVNGLTVEHFKWDNGIDSTVVELFKVNGGEHVWNLPFYPNEIWNFFRQHKNKEITLPTSILNTNLAQEVSIYPNPSRNYIQIGLPSNDLEVSFYNILGEKVLYSTQNKIDISNLNTGNYFVRIQTETISYKGTITVKE